jgi:hypothetical protein
VEKHPQGHDQGRRLQGGVLFSFFFLFFSFFFPFIQPVLFFIIFMIRDSMDLDQ